jgi:Xaa-Pro dipeptidase
LWNWGSTGVTTDTLSLPALEVGEPKVGAVSDRRADIDAKMARVAALLQEVNCEGLLLLEPENLAWLTSGAVARGQLDPTEAPAAYCNGEARWILAGNVDSQRIFDEEVDGLGFQLKEWPWHWGREQMLLDLVQNRRVACDRPFGELTPVAAQLRQLRRLLTTYEQACYRVLGHIISHALEATCRTMEPNQTEREIAGQISHRLMHRGVFPLQVGVAADARSRHYRNFGFTSTIITNYVQMTTTARKYGLVARASRAACFGTVPDDIRSDHNAVCRVGASYMASTWPEAVPREVLLAGRRIYQVSGYEHEWLVAQQGHLTGRAPVELAITPKTEELLQAGHVVTWHASAGAAASCDTFLVTDEGPKILTPTEAWPLKRIRIQGAEFVRPDVFTR